MPFQLCFGSTGWRVRPRAYAIRPYQEIRTLRPLRTLRLIFRMRTGPVATGPYSVISVPSVMNHSSGSRWIVMRHYTSRRSARRAAAIVRSVATGFLTTSLCRNPRRRSLGVSITAAFSIASSLAMAFDKKKNSPLRGATYVAAHSEEPGGSHSAH